MSEVLPNPHVDANNAREEARLYGVFKKSLKKTVEGAMNPRQTNSQGVTPEIAPGVKIESEFPPELSYKGELTRSMEYMATDPLVRFIGYGVKIGGKAMGTLKNVADSQLIEMPVAENLMVGFAIGLSLKGLRPVVFIERFDFILNALDAIVNHLDKIESISRGEFQPSVILRVVVGNRQKPLFTGETHTQDFSAAMRLLIEFPVIGLHDASTIFAQYKAAHAFLGSRSTMLVEYKDAI